MAVCAQSEAKWLSTRHNFGAFAENEGPVSCEFKVVNTGTEAFNILNAKASCGCTTPAYQREPVEPGDTATVVVAYNPAGRPGRFNKTVLVETDAAVQPTVRLSVQGVVIGDGETVAARYPVDRGALKFRVPMMAFGPMTKGKLKTVYTDAYNSSRDCIRAYVERKPRYIDIMFEPKTVGPGEQLTIIGCLRSSEADTWGLLEDSVIIKAGSETLVLPLTAMIDEDFSGLGSEDLAKAPHIQVKSETIDLGRINGTEPLERTVEVTNTGKSPLELRRIYSTDAEIEVSVDKTTIGKGKTGHIRVTVDPAKADEKMVNARVTIISNDPSRPTVTLRVIGEK